MNRLKHEPAYSRAVRQLERYQHCHDPHLAGLSVRHKPLPLLAIRID